MSRIFDALKRSESERWGNDLGTPPESVTELLQAAEGRRIQQQIETLVPPATGVEAFAFGSAPTLRPAPSPEARLVCLTDPGSMGAEKFRVLGLRLRHLRDKRKLRRVVVTGTAPEEGKSLIAANLALNQARSKVLKTLLIDGDFRRPSLAKRFGVGELLPGLSECLRGERQLSEVVYQFEGSGLCFLPAGMAPENPLELMQSGRLSSLMRQLADSFDWIIVDSPPLLPLADTTVWSRLTDGTLLVAREGTTQKGPLQRGIEVIKKSNLLGVVLNGCTDVDHENYYRRYSPAAPQ